MKKNIHVLIATIFTFVCLSHITHVYALCCQPAPTTCAPCGHSDRSCCIGICDGYPYLLTRPQGRNAARDLVATQAFIHKYNGEKNNSTTTISVEYQRSFWPDQIARFLFGDDYINCCNLCIQGSSVEDRHPKAWLADYFGLPMDFESNITFCPRIQNVIIDIDFYLGLDEITKGLYAKFDFPIAWTKWELNPCEKICNRGEAPFPTGYMSEEEIPREQLSSSFLQYMECSKTFGDMQQPLQYGRIYRGARKKTRLAEIRGSLGYKFVQDCDYHFGFFMQLSIPTGNKRCSKYLFEPIVGNGKHAEFGGGISGSWIFHRSDRCEDTYVGIWLDATITHLFKRTECRSFDFACKPNSRYMLIQELQANRDNIQGLKDSTLTKADYQYKRNLIPAINWSTFPIEVRMDIQTDIAAKIGFVKNAWSFDLGYNFWAITGEKFEQDCCCGYKPFYNYGVPSCSLTFAHKGDAFVYGSDRHTMYPVSATQSLADIHSGKNYPSIDNDLPTENLRIDNPQQAFVNRTGLSSLTTTTFKTSIQPVTLQKSNLNLGDAPSAMTHKIFFHLGYASTNQEECITPFIGIGGQVEFAKNRCNQCCKSCNNAYCSNNCNCKSPTCSNKDEICCYTCDDCCDTSCDKRAGVSQWGIWLKLGLHFE